MSEVAKKVSDLPEGWGEFLVGHLGKAITGNTPPTKDLKNYGGDIPFIKPTELVDRPVSIGRETISEKGAELARVLPKGGVLVSCIGYLGKTAIAKREVAFNQQINAIIFNDAVLPEYGFYYFQSLKFKNDLAALATGTTISIVNKSKFESISMPVAPFQQQKRIVAKIEELFSHIDAGIAALNQAKKLVKQYRQSVLKAAVTGELTKQWREENKDKLEPASKLLDRILIERREKWEAQQLEQFKAKGKLPKDDKWKGKYKEPENVNRESLPDIPEEWVWARLDSVAFVGTGMSVSKSREVVNPIDVAYLRVANVQRGHLILDKVKTMRIEKEKLEQLKLQEWDVLYNEGGDIDKLGRGWIWEKQDETCITQNHVFRASPYIKQRNHSIFLSVWGNTFGQDYFIDTGKQTTNLASINKGVLSAFPTPLPCIEEQIKVIELVEEKLTSIERLEVEVNMQLIKAEKNKQSILASAFSGRLN